MRRVAGVLVAALLAAAGAVILGEYDLEGLVVVVGFPLFALAVTEVAIAVGGRLGWARGPVAVVVGAALAWSLWISFNHFRRGSAPVLSWAMVAAAVLASFVWSRPNGRARPGSEVLGGDEGAVPQGEQEQQEA